MSRHAPAGKVFKVRIDVELPSEVLERIERAIQKAVLTELADTDVASGYSVVMRAPANGEGAAAGAGGPEPLSADRREGGVTDPFGSFGSTDGIWIREDGGEL